MRIGTLLAEDAGDAFWNALAVPRNGRLTLTKWILQGLSESADVDEVAVFGSRRQAPVGGVTMHELEDLPAWYGSDVVWFEPLRHFWYRPALLRRASSMQFPIVTMIHSLGYPGQVGPTLASLALQHLPCDAVVAPSQCSADVFLHHCNELAEVADLESNRVNMRVLPYGCPVPIRVPRRQARHAIGWDDSPLILFVGRLNESDKADFDALLTAFRAVTRDHEGTRLILGGSATSNAAVEDLQAKVVQMGLGGAVEVRPNLSEVEKHLYYDAADIFVSPSNALSESFGLTIVEAMLHGLPIVCSAWSGYRELVRHGVDGLHVDMQWNARQVEASEVPFIVGVGEELANVASVDCQGLAAALSTLLGSNGFRRQLGQSAKRRAERHYTIGRTVAGLSELFTELQTKARIGPAGGTLRMVNAFKRYASSLPVDNSDCRKTWYDQGRENKPGEG